ncbi:very short patch repair endonuclease [Sabulicella glaciei]|uniref:Very short patch repair endonuclease n=1 Tax=Sabulicella glaciei TaxID=2984948 RepID=A0ABT3P0J0_9PROT|nr:very short patch repair endonuclease [Roseococcus sp. MDT2-1-1]MCW8087698.1 very short patch repair endonuclease [Roseococcus sp. MDT2-1-1]
MNLTHLGRAAGAAAHAPLRLTGPEQATLDALLRAGLGPLRCHAVELRGTPDLVLDSHRVCVFVHGCFWHHHRGCQLARVPTTNRAFWEAKFARNQARDAAVLTALQAQGWRTIMVRECATRRMQATRLGAELKRLLESGATHAEITSGPPDPAAAGSHLSAGTSPSQLPA